MTFLVGVASEDITCPQGTPMGGYWAAERFSGVQSIADPLRATVLVMRAKGAGSIVSEIGLDGIERTAGGAAIVALDLCALTEALALRIRHVVGVACDLPLAAVLTNCSHTHSGPLTGSFVGMGDWPSSYIDFLIGGIVRATERAIAALSPAKVGYTKLDGIGLGVCRRVVLPEKQVVGGKVPWFECAGRCILGEDSSKPCPDHAHVLVFYSGAGNDLSLAAVLWSAACHPVICGKNPAVSADWPGAACREIESICGGIALFLQGAAGDINPRGCRGAGIVKAHDVGKSLGQKIASTVASVCCLEPEDVTTSWRTEALPLAPPPPLAEARSFHCETRALQASAPEHDLYSKAAHEIACRTVALAEGTPLLAEDAATSRRFELQSVSFGGIATLIGMGGEIFSSFARSLETSDSSAGAVIVLGFCNTVIGYVGPASAWADGGYEICHAHRVYGHVSNVSPLAEGHILTTAKKLLDLGERRKLVAEVLPSGFLESCDVYNGLGVDECGNIIFALSSAKADVPGRIFKYLSRLPGRIVKSCASLDEACDIVRNGSSPPIAQGKVHCSFTKGHDGRLRFATHIGYYSEDAEGTQFFPEPPPSGMASYPGGHFLALDPSTGKCQSYGVLRTNWGAEGAVSHAFDSLRLRHFALSWPTGQLVICEEITGTVSVVGPTCGDGEAPHPRTGRYRPVCRCIAVDPTTGAAYLSNAAGDVLCWQPDGKGLVTCLKGEAGLRRAYFGEFDESACGTMAYNWRQVKWCERLTCFFGIHGSSGIMFRFDPPQKGTCGQVVVLERLTSSPSRRVGAQDMCSYGYLGFDFGPDGVTLHYLTGGRLPGTHVARAATKGESLGEEALHLVTHDVLTNQTIDHGAIELLGSKHPPAYVNSLTVGHDGAVFFITRLPTGHSELAAVSAMQIWRSNLRTTHSLNKLRGSLADLIREYEKDLQETSAFWQKSGIDVERGGIHCALCDDGSLAVAKKVSVFQGRGAWLFATLGDCTSADRCVSFAKAYCRTPHGGWYDAVTTEGTPLEGAGCCEWSSIFLAEGLVAMACAEPQSTQCMPRLQEALQLVKDFVARHDDPTVIAAESYLPFPAGKWPPGTRTLARHMLPLRVATQALIGAAKPGMDAAAVALASGFESIAKRMRKHILNDFVAKDSHGLCYEVLAYDYTPLSGPAGVLHWLGHAVEALWFVLDDARRCNDAVDATLAARALKRHVDQAWDNDHGGLVRAWSAETGYTGFEDKAAWVQQEALVALVEIAVHGCGGSADEAELRDWAAGRFLELHAWCWDHLRLGGGRLWRVGATRDGRGDASFSFGKVPSADCIPEPRKEHYHHPRCLLRILDALCTMQSVGSNRPAWKSSGSTVKRRRV